MFNFLIGAFWIMLAVVTTVWVVRSFRQKQKQDEAERERRARHEQFLDFLATVRQKLSKQ